MLDTSSAAAAAVDAIGLPIVSYDYAPPTLIEDVRKMGEAMRELLQRIENQIDEQHQHATSTSDVDEMQRLQDADPFRWHADAKHSLQSGIMFAERAVAQPATF